MSRPLPIREPLWNTAPAEAQAVLLAAWTSLTERITNLKAAARELQARLQFHCTIFSCTISLKPRSSDPIGLNSEPPAHWANTLHGVSARPAGADCLGKWQNRRLVDDLFVPSISTEPLSILERLSAAALEAPDNEAARNDQTIPPSRQRNHRRSRSSDAGRPTP